MKTLLQFTIALVVCVFMVSRQELMIWVLAANRWFNG
jgi:hypothetical protein